MEKQLTVEIQGIRKDSIDKTNNLIAVVYTNNVFKNIHIDRIVGDSRKISVTPTGSDDLSSYTLKITALYSAVAIGGTENVAADSIKQFEEALFNAIKEINKNSKDFRFTYIDEEYSPTVVKQSDFASTYAANTSTLN